MLDVFYITNNLEMALAAEDAGVNRVWIDLETLGKEERQKGINSVKSHHTIDDIRHIRPRLTKAKMMVRVNPWNENSVKEIDEVIEAGAQIVMLPMWKTAKEVSFFLNAVRGRALTSLLLETKEAEECLNDVLNLHGIDEIHVGLNDLHLSYGLSFMFELLSNGTIDRIVDKIKPTGIPYGFGGISHLGDGLIPAEMVIMEHYRLGSTRAILSRGFCAQTQDLKTFKNEFKSRMNELRWFESNINPLEYADNKAELAHRVEIIVRSKT